MSRRQLNSMLLCLVLGFSMLAGCEPTSTSPKSAEIDSPDELPVITKPMILVAGVTGRQGSALAKQLLKLGYPVRGTTRNPNSDKASAMTALGVEVVQADFSDPQSLAQATREIYGLFFYTPGGPQEITMGKNITDAAIAADVKHIIYSTYLSADPTNGYPEEQPKRTIENYIRDKGIGYTFLRPVSFMENFAGRQSSISTSGISAPQSPDYVGQYISVQDIAMLATEAFEKPGEWMAKELNIASDEMTQQEAAELFSNVLGKPVAYNQVSWEETANRMPPQLIKVFQWYETSGFKADVTSLRQRYPNMMTLEQYLRDTGWENWRPAP